MRDSHQRSPTVSVVVPCFNASRYIDEALQSLRSQTLQDLEIIVVDDASEDDSRERVRRHINADSRVRLIALERPSGSASAPRNRGIEEATGVYIAFLDADDIALPYRLERTVAAMQLHRIAIGFADFAIFTDPYRGTAGVGFLRAAGYLDRAGSRYRSIGANTWRADNAILGFMIGSMVGVNIPTFVAERSALADMNIRFDESLIGGEDLDVFFQLARSYPLVFIDEVLTLVRRSTGSLTARRRLQCARDAVVVRHRHMAKLANQMAPSELSELSSAIAWQYADVGYGYYNNGNSRIARELYRKSWAVRPTRNVVVSYAKTLVSLNIVRRLRARREARRGS